MLGSGVSGTANGNGISATFNSLYQCKAGYPYYHDYIYCAQAGTSSHYIRKIQVPSNGIAGE